LVRIATRLVLNPAAFGDDTPPYHRVVTKTRYRLIFTLLGLALAVIVIAAVVFMPSGRTPILPAAVQSYAPTDGAIVMRQTKVTLDLDPGFEIFLIVDDVPIPEDEVSVVEATGVFTWEPGPGRTFEEWAPGFHTVEVRWDRAVGLPEPGSLSWAFRVQ